MKVAVMGYGTVGSGVVDVIENHEKMIARRTNDEKLEVKYILDLRDFPDDKHQDAFTKDFNDILNDDEVKIVAETMGGVNPAFDFTMKLLKAGKSVVTSNKELVAQKGLELLKTAKENNVNYLIEASVGGGIPIIRPLSSCLAGNNVEAIAGILNGTTNFILAKMIDDGMNFDDALKLAQDNGFAEKDPTADIEGHDACRKVCILASIAFGKHIYPSQVECEGITKITLEDVEYVENAGAVIKLLGQIKAISENEIAAFVAPGIVDKSSLLSAVNGVNNAVLVRGDAVEDVCFYGPGAGKLPTASAVVGDIVDCVNHQEKRKVFGWGEGEENFVVDHKKALKSPFYVRANASKGEIDEIFGEVKYLARQNQPEGEVAFITSDYTENDVKEMLNSVDVINIIKVTNY